MSDANKPDFEECAKQLMVSVEDCNNLTDNQMLKRDAEQGRIAAMLEEMYERGHSDGRDSAMPGPPPVVDLILRSVDDLVSNFLYYDRKEDEDLPMGAIEQAIIDGHLKWEDIVEHFQEKLLEGLETEWT